nr:tetratricopeptide repeat protein [uncultured Desulfobacter sp.]
MIFFQNAFSALLSAATNPLALAGYLAVILSYTIVALKMKRNKQVLDALEKISEKDRRRVLEAEMGHVPIPIDMTAEQYIETRILHYRHIRYWIIAGVVVLLCAIVAWSYREKAKTYTGNILNEDKSKEHVTDEIKPASELGIGVRIGDDASISAGGDLVISGKETNIYNIIQGIDERDLDFWIERFQEQSKEGRIKEVDNWYKNKEITSNLKEALIIVIQRIDKELQVSQKTIEKLKSQGKYDLAELWERLDKAFQQSPSALEIEEAKALNIIKQKAEQKAANDEIEFYLSMGERFNSILQFKNAITRFESALNLLEAYFKKGDERISLTLNRLGLIYLDLAEYQKALERFKKALTLDLKEFGLDHPYVARDKNNIGLVYHALGQYHKAIKYYENALTVYLKDPRPDPEAVAIVWSNLGRTLISLGNYKEAIEYFEKALASDLKNFGPGYSNVARDWSNLGLALNSLGNYPKAIEYFEKALASDLKKFGPDHPKVATDWNNMGVACYSLGQYQKAIEYFEKTLAVNLKNFGTDHPDVARDWSNLGLTWISLNKSQKAIEYLEKALALNLKKFGTDHPQMSILYNNLGGAWNSLGQSQKAIKYFEKALALDLKKFGTDHLYVARDWNNIGLGCYSLGQYQKAFGYFDKALSIFNKKLEPNHPFTRQANNNKIMAALQSFGAVQKIDDNKNREQ